MGCPECNEVKRAFIDFLMMYEEMEGWDLGVRQEYMATAVRTLIMRFEPEFKTNNELRQQLGTAPYRAKNKLYHGIDTPEAATTNDPLVPK